MCVRHSPSFLRYQAEVFCVDSINLRKVLKNIAEKWEQKNIFTRFILCLSNSKT